MASIGVKGSDVVVDVAVFRGLVDLMLDYPGLGDEATAILTQERDVGTLTIDLLTHPVREELEAALGWACRAAREGERSSRSGEDVAAPARLVEGAEAVCGLFP